jgi:hypothetical protein
MVCYVRASSLAGQYNLCQTHAKITSHAGDSGAPVFIPWFSNEYSRPRPAGTVTAGSQGSTWFSVTSQVINALGYKYFLVW